ncbi:hypothetical protein BJX68DRAFT_229288 [Aspergillus pseudodeflectus]|uniref:Uncharacterized protein n=1 Tax=Aspergillus pseudodeflectus TaxID=176178 RepID=A0ABR4KZE3_9EURO
MQSASTVPAHPGLEKHVSAFFVVVLAAGDTEIRSDGSKAYLSLPMTYLGLGLLGLGGGLMIGLQAYHIQPVEEDPGSIRLGLVAGNSPD